MTYTPLTQPLRGYTDQASYRARSSDYTKSCLNVMPFDVFERRLRIGTRQGFCAVADVTTGGQAGRIQAMLPYEVYRDNGSGGTDLVQRILIIQGGKVYDAAPNGPQNAALGNHVPVAATSSITFGGLPAVDQTIILKDNSDPQVSQTYTAKAAEDLSARQFNQSGTAAQAATSLAACINNSAGHNGTITASASDAVVTVTQATAGALGNTAITSTLANTTVANSGAFANGTGATWRIPGTLSTSAKRIEAKMLRGYAYLADGTDYFRIDLTQQTPVLEHWWEYKTNSPSGETASQIHDKDSATSVRPDGATIMQVWGSRIVLAGFATTPNVWVACSVGDPNQWNPKTNDAGFGIAGGNSPEYAILGDRITALYPFGTTGLLIAGKDSMAYMNADPVFGDTALSQLSRDVGAFGPRAVCAGPEKSAYVVANDGVYHVKPNDFDINRGDRISAGALDGLFSRTQLDDLGEVLAVYDEGKGVLQVFLSRENQDESSRHAAYDVNTQSWWPFDIADSNNPNPVCSATFKPYSNDRQTIWLGGTSGRISAQPANGVYPQDGLKVTDSASWTVSETPADIDCRVMLGPINTDISQRVLLRDVRVRLQSDTEVQTTGDQGGLASGMPTTAQVRDLTSSQATVAGQTTSTQFSTDIATLSIFDITAVEISDVADQNVQVTDNILSTNTSNNGAGQTDTTFIDLPGASAGDDEVNIGDNLAGDTTTVKLRGGYAASPAGTYLRQTDDAALTFYGPDNWVLFQENTEVWVVRNLDDTGAIFQKNNYNSLPGKIYDADFLAVDPPTNVSFLSLAGSIDTDPAEPISTHNLRTGLNNSLRMRIRETDLYFQISSTGRSWAIEDISVDIEPGGPVRTVRS